MNELVLLEKKGNPDEILLVLDAMTGQEAANVAKRFAATVHVSGAILTKLDSDTRGGAALSLSNISGCSICFMGTSENLDGLEPFYPERIASRILGMGDIVSLVEKAQENVNEEEAKEMAKRMLEAKFTFEDFLKQLSFVSSMGSLGNMLKMVPGVGNRIKSEDISKMENKLKVAKIIIQSMTKEEKKNPELFYDDVSSKKRMERIRKGCGRSQEEIDDFFKTFKSAQIAMKKLGASANQKAEKSSEIESQDFTGNRAQRRKLTKTKESVPKNTIKKGFGK
ncbi:signal recognition particle subunit SRP54 [Galdieria sulphuraria]|uniref:Signal recognition particle subunit SRP54 n=1 Tax=Galdieria sulphuraria TaxID=130081 RepID=M2XCX4_GALSU|nr:signal recognition particle subunit SRP54 [Galdieria sulphuraria]EME27807.1 signal recognition particle subunit SRP54 [Galdieria sulphuraria]|eukprot:XP_005704327.1 signal recognition particle subunit SRP54 [Galdieria sulphuraria]